MRQRCVGSIPAPPAKPFTYGANVEFHARGSNISSSREGVPKDDPGQAIRHVTGVSTLKPDPLRVTSFRQGDGQWIERGALICRDAAMGASGVQLRTVELDLAEGSAVNQRSRGLRCEALAASLATDRRLEKECRLFLRHDGLQALQRVVRFANEQAKPG